MTAMTLQKITGAGLLASYAAVADGDTIPAGGSDRVFLHVKNGDTGSINVTVAATRATATVPGVGTLTVPDIVVAVPAGEDRMIGPFPPAYTAADGTVTVNYDSVISITAAALDLGKSA